jgi:hypothetical protein
VTTGRRDTSEDGVVSRRDERYVVVASLAGSYSPTTIDLRAWQCDPHLREQLADAIEMITGVNGTWRSSFGTRINEKLVKRFATWCGEHNVHALGELTPVKWNSYLLHLAQSGVKGNTQQKQVSKVRQLLRCYPHRLHPDLPKHLNRRLPQRDADESQPLPMDVYYAILKAATVAVNAEYQRIQPHLELLAQREAGQLPAERKAFADALHEVATTGAAGSAAARDALGITVHRCAGIIAARPKLFVTFGGAVAVSVLIACLEGANLAPINERKVPSAAPGLGVADDIWTVEDEKRRRQKYPYEAHPIPKNARRAMAKIIEMTQPARDYLAANELPGSDRLIVYWPGRGGGPTPSVGLEADVFDRKRIDWWPDPDLPISFNRIRKTVRVLIDRAPQGHSRATWSTSYIEASEVERERLMTEAVETGLWTVIKSAESHLKMRFERIPAATDTDTAIAACSDWEHHPLTGQPCGDDFLLCLQCKNAFATPRHLPRLIELRHQLEAIASTDGPDWTDFRAMAYGCLVALIDDRTLITGDEYLAAKQAICDDDRAVIQMLLNGRYA